MKEKSDCTKTGRVVLESHFRQTTWQKSRTRVQGAHEMQTVVGRRVMGCRWKWDIKQNGNIMLGSTFEGSCVEGMLFGIHQISQSQLGPTISILDTRIIIEDR